MKVKILLLCDNVVRELDALKFLRSVLIKELDAEVSIIGSLAEWERIYYLLQRIKPRFVFLTQIQEQKCRELALYVRESGAQICIIPPETTLVAALKNITVNPLLKYNDLVDFLFLPGESLKKLYKNVDIEEGKIFVTGSPRVDMLVKAKGEGFYSRTKFAKIFGIPSTRKNIFVFTSFRHYSREYIKSDVSFTGVTRIANRESDFIDKSLAEYMQMLPKLCKRFPQYNIIVKAHPLEDENTYKKISDANFYMVPRSYTLQACLKSIDLAIHWNSTVAMECWLHGIKTVQYSPRQEYFSFLSELRQGNPLFATFDSLIEGIQRYLVNDLEKKYTKFQRKYLKINYGSLKPDASMRITRILAKTMKSKVNTIQYKKAYRSSYLLFIILEKVLGIRLSRWLISLFVSEYQWKYAVENYVYET